MRRWTSGEEDFLRTHYSVMSLEKIAGVLGRTPGAIAVHVYKKDMDVKRYRSRPRGWTEKEDVFLCENFASMGAVKVAQHLGRHNASVSNRAKKFGLQADKHFAWTQIRHQYFNTIASPVKAYVLGWLATDGNVVDCRKNGSVSNEIRIELHEKDARVVEFIRDELAPFHGLYYRIRDTTPNACFRISSPQIKEDLARWNVVPRKTHILKYPDIPVEFDNSFILGCFDGDGSLIWGSNKAGGEKKYPTWQLVSASNQFLLDVQTRIHNATGVMTSNPKKQSGSAAWEMRAYCSKAKLIDAWLHADLPGLARKRIPGGHWEGCDVRTGLFTSC